MYYDNLRFINRNLKTDPCQKISSQQLQIFSNFLEELYPNETVSPQVLSYETSLTMNQVIELLVKLSERNLLLKEFIIQCNNENPHSFHFTKLPDIINFVNSNKELCPECGAKLLKNNSSVLFRKPSKNIIMGVSK